MDRKSAKRISPLGICRAALGLLAAVLAGPAVAQTRQAPEKPRVAVIGAPETPARAEKKAWVRAAILELTNGLLEQGHQVVALGPPLGSASSRGERLRAWKDYTEVLILVGVRSERERKQQGRFRVTDRLELRMLHLIDGSTLLERSRAASGFSFASYGAAHREAVGRLCTRVPGSLFEEVTARLEALEEVERQEGALMTVELSSDQMIPGLDARFNASLRKLAGVRTETVSLIGSRTTSHSRGRFPALNLEYRLRYRGPGHELGRTLLDMAAGLAAEPGADRARPALHITVSPRRISLDLQTDPPESEQNPVPSPADVVKKKVGQLVDRLLLDHRSIIAGARLAVEPATIQAPPKPSASRDRPAAARRSSLAGDLAADMTKTTVHHLEAGGLDVLPLTAAPTSAAKRLPAADPKEERGFDPEAVRLLGRAGADAAVLPGLIASPGSYVLRLVLVDCATGTELLRLGHRLDERFRADLDALVNG